MKEEIEALFIEQRHRFGDCIIGSARLVNGSVVDGKKIGLVINPTTIKGDADEGELKTGVTYRFYGRWTEYFNKRSKAKEKQFAFDTFVQSVPYGEEGVVAYLMNAGEGNGMGINTAKKVWRRYGWDVIKVLREDGLLLKEFNPRITDEQCKAIQAKLVAQQKTEAATIELTNLLSGRGFLKKLPRKLIEKWGNKAAEIVRKDPYSLMNFRGCGFKLCDNLYLELGLPKDRLRRQALCGWYAIASDSSGDVWFPQAKVEQAIRQQIGPKANPSKAVELAQRLGRISPSHYGAIAVSKTAGRNGHLLTDGDERASSTAWVAEGNKARQERLLADLVIRALDEALPGKMTVWGQIESIELSPREHIKCHRCARQLTAPEVHVWNNLPFGPTCIGYISDGTDVEVHSLKDWLDGNPVARKIVREAAKGVVDLPEFSLWPDPAEIKQVTDHQREQLGLATVGRIGILGGSPGTGKTHSVVQLVQALLASGRVGIEDIAIGCPTGKAAVRITEALQAAGLPLRAKTWHSLLGIGEVDDRDGWGFKYGQNNPWPYRVIIGDEWSMLDLSIATAVFSARPRGCHMLLVGDICQLPPVGAGAPLRDLIEAGLPYGELTEIKRNTGGIVEACRDIRNGVRWVAGDNLHVVSAQSPEAQIEAAERIIDSCRANGLDPIWDVQILVALNKTSPLARKKINDYFQGVLNPPGDNANLKETFRVDDKIVGLKNGYFLLLNPSEAYLVDESLLNEQGQVYVANGQLAKVIEVEEKSLIARLDKTEITIRIPRGKQEKDNESDDEDAGNGCSFDLAYGLSCHKMQGSECPVVIVMIDESPGAKMVCSREWLYTALSRAKQDCYVVGKKATADGFCRKQSLPMRKTFLREQIGLVRAEKLLESVL